MNIEDVNPELMEKIYNGDPACAIPVKTRVRKSFRESKDLHFEDDLGTVEGSIQINGQDCYLVHFDNDAEQAVTFILGYKIEKI